MSSAVVQWSRSCLRRADDPGSTPGDAVFCFFVPFFFSVFNPIFPFGLFSYIDAADHVDHALGSLYVSVEFYFGKWIFQELVICIPAKLTARKKHKQTITLR